MVSTIKFSQFASGGDLPNGVTTVGLDGTLTINTRFNNPWTFLAPGSTASRPIPSVAIDGRLRFNTDTLTYEYYDTLSAMWVELSGSGTGTINPGVTNDIPFYPANGTTLSPLAAAANAVLVTSAGSVPSLSTTLPSGLTIPGASISSATITASTAALTAGSVVAAPVAGTDLTNKTYVDGLFASGVDSITGTTNQVIASSPTGNVTLSLPQDIATGSSPTFSTLTLSSSTAHGVILGQAGSPFHYVSPFATSGVPLISQGAAADPAYGTAVVAGGGTGNTTFTAYSVICAGTTASGAFQNVSGVGTANQVLVSNGAAALPTWQSVPGVTPAALTKTDDTNVTLTLGGTPATALLQATSLTLGWTGSLAETRGGTHQTTYTLGDTLYASAANTLSKLAGNTTSGIQYLSQTGTGAVSAAPAWATISGGDITGAALTKTDDTNVTLTLGGTPSTALLRAASLTLGWTGQLSLTRGGTNASLTASNGGIFYSTATAGAILSGTATANQLLMSGASTTPAWSTSTYPATNAISTLLYASSANVMAALATANSAVLVTNSTGVPAWSGTMTNGQLIIGSTSATPTAATLSAGSGITITNGAGSITISSSTSGMTWSTVSGTTQAAAVNNGYVTNNAGAVTVTLPTTFAVGDEVEVKGLGAGGWILAAGTATTIRDGSSVTSSAGSLASTNQYDTVKVTGLVANTTWSVDYSFSSGLTVA